MLFLIGFPGQGQRIQEFSIDDLNIDSGEFEYELYVESKSIVFRKVSSQEISGCKSEYEKIRGTPQDKLIVNVVSNNSNTVIYRKGPLVLVRIAEQIGYGELMSIISGFYREYAGKYPLKYMDFIDMVNECYPGAGDQLNILLSVQSL